MTSLPPPDNPYRPTEASRRARDLGSRTRSKGLLVNAVLTAVGMTFAAFRFPPLMEEFRGLFKGFGAELPPLTSFFLATPLLWIACAIGSWWICIRVWTQAEMTVEAHTRWTRIVRLNTLAMGLLIGLCVYSMYVPMFKLGQVV